MAPICCAVLRVRAPQRSLRTFCSRRCRHSGHTLFASEKQSRTASLRCMHAGSVRGASRYSMALHRLFDATRQRFQVFPAASTSVRRRDAKICQRPSWTLSFRVKRVFRSSRKLRGDPALIPRSRSFPDSPFPAAPRQSLFHVRQRRLPSSPPAKMRAALPAAETRLPFRTRVHRP